MTRIARSVLVRSQGTSIKPNVPALPIPKPWPARNWTMLQWSPSELRYVKPTAGLNQTKHTPTKRNPRVDTLLKDRQKVDLFAPVFVATMKADPAEAEALLHELALDLSPNALEEYALVLAIHLQRVPSLPPSIQNRYKVIEHALRLPITANKASESPIDLLAQPIPDIPSGGSYSDLFSSMSPELQQKFEAQYLEFNWRKQVQLDSSRVPLPGLYDAWKQAARYHPLQAYNLQSIKTQVPEIVAAEMARAACAIASATFPQPVTGLCKRIGAALEDAMLRKKASELKLPYFSEGSPFLWGLLGGAAWSIKDRLIVGSVYVEQALKKFKFEQVHPHTGGPVERPAFWRTFHIQGTSRRGIVALNPALLDQLGSSTTTSPSSDQLPMVVEPKKWTSIRQGAFYGRRSRKLTLLAPGLRSNEQLETVSAAIESGAMSQSLDGVDRLASCAWRINKTVLSTIRQLQRQNKCVSDMPGPDDDSAQYNQALAVGDSLAEHGHRFYTPAYLDFRGRCYTTSGSKLNHMAGDSFRALHEFWYGRALGPDGLHALELHLANVYGSGRGKSIQNRISWARDNRKNIIEAATDPVQNRDWWTAADKPFQALAAACEIERALSSGDPISYVSHLPVAVDGSCNGLQHLTALVREQVTAPHVNMTASTASQIPGDIYNHVAQSLKNTNIKISRDMVKTPVMTAFYGASKQGMAKSLKEKFGIANAGPVVDAITTTLSETLDRQFAVQHWLTENAKRIANSSAPFDQENQTSAIAWTQPILGLPVVQPYATAKLMAVRTPLQTFYVDSPFHPVIADPYKQQASVAANYVHTLDAAHMLMTATAFSGTFAAVHDSFWTHARDMTRLGRTLREQFVVLHERPLLCELQAEWSARYGGRYQLCTVSSSSKAYERIVWLRSGKRLRAFELQNELYETASDAESPWTILSEYADEITYDNGQPQLGTGSRSIKAWIPVRISDPPALGNWDPRQVLDSVYFFN